MTKVSDVIDIGETIPDDVTRVADKDEHVWEWQPGARWFCVTTHFGTTSIEAEVLSREWAPLRVTAVREPEPEPSALLDLVRQYGDDRAEAARRVATGGLALDALSRAETLLDRIAALVPQQPDPLRALLLPVWQDFAFSPDEPDNAALVRWAQMLVENGRRDGHALKAASIRIDEVRADRDRIVAAHDHLMGQLRVERDEARRQRDELAELIRTPMPVQPDPSVLSLPQVPDGATALIVLSDEGDEVRFVREGHGWVRGPNDVRGIWRLGTILSEWGDARVVMREPRTWPRLDTISNDLKAVRGASGKVYHRSHFSQSVPVFRERGNDGDPLTGPGHMFYALQTFDGPLTEVFEDEPGGEPR